MGMRLEPKRSHSSRSALLIVYVFLHRLGADLDFGPAWCGMDMGFARTYTPELQLI